MQEAIVVFKTKAHSRPLRTGILMTQMERFSLSIVFRVRTCVWRGCGITDTAQGKRDTATNKKNKGRRERKPGRHSLEA